jgi:hypothetical protein
MAVQQTTNDLSDDQHDKLVTLLRKVETATTPGEAVWLPEDDREDVREIREIIEDN